MYYSIDGKNIEVVIVRKKIKNIYIRVKDNKIFVSANSLVSLKYIESLLKKEENSIRKMLEKDQNKEENEIYYLGDKLEFVNDPNIKITNNIAYGPNIDAINLYLEKNSLNFFLTRLERLKILFDDLPDFKLRVRTMKTRWGVCNKSSMTVTLNTLLIHKDVTLIDYVIIHELCHFKFMNHSKDFWNEVEKYYPYYKLARKRLR
mgnify:CR=1 FL=1